MYCQNQNCNELLTQSDIDSGFYHCSEECYFDDKDRIGTNPYESLFDDPFAEDNEEDEDYE